MMSPSVEASQTQQSWGTATMRASKILLVEDDTKVRRRFRTTLTSAGYVVVEARTGEEALEEVRAKCAADLILLDLKMPGTGELEACRNIRRICDVPIFVLSDLRTQEHKLQAFDAGADDYLVKPFGIRELLSRIHALLRRMAGSESAPPFESSGLKIDFERRRVFVDSIPVHLTPTDFELLLYLVLHRGKPVSHHTLLVSVWGPEHSKEIQRLRVAINQLRRAIERGPGRTRYIQTDRQFGYRFEPILEKSAKQIAES
jgi:two-component system KDP operon response regulator KdpE